MCPIRLNARQLRASVPDKKIIKSIKKNPIYIILDNVLDTYNVGSIFRLADAVAAKKIFLCGETEIPPNPKIKKASINTWQWVSWGYEESAVSAIKSLKAKFAKRQIKLKIICIEQHKKSIPIHQFKPEFPLALVVGNESYGISKQALSLADEIVELPMYGINKSLNVMVCCGIVLYKIIESLNRPQA